MDEFTRRLREIDREKVKQYLCSLQAPCYESTLLSIAFPGIDISHTAPLALYQSHFLLFHLLYHLQDEFYKEGKYLFVHFMRTVLTTYPEKGQCRFFEETLAQFCEAECHPDQSYCDFHATMLGDTALEERSIKYFYLDKHNFYKLDEETAKAFINGTWEILTHYEEYKKSFKVLEIPETSDLKLIKKRFRHLAKQYHPDHGAQSHKKFQEINNAYQFLIQLHSMMMAFNISKKP